MSSVSYGKPIIFTVFQNNLPKIQVGTIYPKVCLVFVCLLFVYLILKTGFLCVVLAIVLLRT